MLLYLDDRFELHQTQSHPECAARISRLNSLLREQEITDQSTCPAWHAAPVSTLARVHDAAYLEQLEKWCAAGAGRIEADTIVGKGSWTAATLAAGAAVDATHRVIAGEDKSAFCAIRPPGHHAIPTGPMGFCVLNNVATAAHAALASGLERVMIVDWDIHHGNGTQDAFYDDPRVAFFSIHCSPFYPGTGAKDETGSRDGLGTTLNAPVKKSIAKHDFFDAFQRGLEQLAEKSKPELILLSAGFDAHHLDPVGGLCLDAQDFAELTRRVQAIAATHSAGRLVSLLEGGYHLDHMPASALAHIHQLLTP